MKFILGLILILATGCVVENNKAPAGAAGNGDEPGVTAPVPTELTGTWNPKTDSSSNFYWCTEFAGEFVCQGSHNIPQGCQNNWPIINNLSVLGGGIVIDSNYGYSIANTVQTVTYGNGQITLMPANMTWGLKIESATRAYVTYASGCTLAFGN